MRIPRFVSTAIISTVALLLIPSVASTIIRGGQTDCRFGFSVASGDINGDDVDDVVVGAPYYDYSGSDRGAVFVFLGPLNGSMDEDDAHLRILGESAGDLLGFSVALGDVNGDGYADIVMGAPENDEALNGAGQVYVVFGHRRLISGTRSAAISNASYHGEALNSRTGRAVFIADLNGDGNDDIAIGAPYYDGKYTDEGAVYVVFGRVSNWSKDWSLRNPDMVIFGSSPGDMLGFNITAGDVTGDGYDDLIMGAPFRNQGGTESGAVYIEFGRASGWSESKRARATNASIIGDHDGQRLGWSLTAGADVNGDGRGDILLGTPHEGKAYLFYGSTDLRKDTSVSAADAIFNGSVDDRTGSSLSFGLCDRNLIWDIAISSPGNGSVHLFTSHHPYQNVTQSDYTLNSSSSFGFSITTGDSDGDGIHEIIGGSPLYNGNVLRSGAVLIREPLDNTLPSITSLEVYVDSNYSSPSFFVSIDRAIYFRANGSVGNSSARDLCWIMLTTTSDGRGIMVPLLETDEDSGEYRGSAFLKAPTNERIGQITSAWGDWVNVSVGSISVSCIANVPPKILGTDRTVIDEDATYLVDYTYEDGNGDQIIWSVSTNASWLAWDPNETRLYGIPTNLDVGIYYVNITIDDGLYGVDSRLFDITVVNTPPIIITSDVTSATEDVYYEVDYTSEDDGMGAIWSMFTNASFLSFDSDEAILYGTPSNQDVGTYWVNVSVIDGNGGSDWHNFTLDVINLPLTILTSDVTTATEDILYSVDYNSTDDPDTYWMLETNAPFLEINSTTGVLSGYPTDEHVGPWWVNVSVSDYHEGLDYHNFTIWVLNTPPEITGDDNLTPIEDIYYEVSYNATDPEISWSFLTNATWLTLDVLNGTLRGTPSDEDVGSFYLVIQAFDRWGGFDRRDLIIEVQNRPPVISNDWTGNAVEDTPFISNFSASDPGVIWTIHGPSWLSINGTNGTVWGTPRNRDVGNSTVIVTAEDRHGGISEFRTWIDVTNRPPVILTPDPAMVTEDKPLIWDFNSTDDPVSWHLDTSAGFLTIDASGILFGTPDNGDVGNHSVNISCDDGHGGIDYHRFILEVINVPPKITNTDIRYAKEDAQYRVDYNSTDDPVIWYLETDADFLSITDDGVLYGIPTNVDVGSYDVTVICDDGHGGRAARHFTLQVNNTKPVIVGTPVYYVYERETYVVNFTTEENGAITWMLTTNISWLTLDPENGTLQGTPTNGDVGLFNVSIALYDGNGMYDLFTFPLRVLNRKPVILTAPVTEASEDRPYGVLYRCSDTGGIISWRLRTNATFLRLKGAYLYGTPTDDDVGVFWVEIEVDDGNGAHSISAFNLTVTPLPPTIFSPYIPLLHEDEPFRTSFTCDDTEVRWSITSDVTFLIIDARSGNVSGTPQDMDVGAHYMNVTATDRWGITGWANVTFSVLNKPPSITASPPETVMEDQLYRARFNASDPDVIWTMDGPSFLSISPTTGLVIGRPGDGDLGVHEITINVSDVHGGTGSFTYVLEVLNLNDPPEILGQDVLVTNGTEIYQVQYISYDPDDSELTWKLKTNASFLSITSNGTLIGRPTNRDAGWYHVNITLIDPHGASDARSFTLVVKYKDLPPILFNGRVVPSDGDEATPFHFTVWYYDPEKVPPSEICVIIDGEVHQMVLNYGDAHDGLYSFRTKLSSGTHIYFFSASDGRNEAEFTNTPSVNSEATIGVRKHDEIGTLLRLEFMLVSILTVLTLLLVYIYILRPQRRTPFRKKILSAKRKGEEVKAPKSRRRGEIRETRFRTSARRRAAVVKAETRGITGPDRVRKAEKNGPRRPRSVRSLRDKRQQFP